MPETPTSIRFSIVGYVAMLTTTAGILMFVASLVLPVNKGGGDTGAFAMWLGIFGSFAMVPHGRLDLWVQSVLGTMLNLTLWIAALRSFRVRSGNSPLLVGSGCFLLCGYLIFNLFPVQGYDGISYRIWVSSFLMGGVGILLSDYDRRVRKSALLP